MKILFLLYSNTDTCSLYRAGGVASDLRDRCKINNLDIHCREYSQIIAHWQFLLEYDMVMMQRPFNNHALTIGSYIKNLHIPLWMDWDDNLLDVPIENRMYPHMVKERETIVQLIGMADAISVPTKRLKEEFEGFNDNIWIIPNAFNDIIFKNYKLPKERKPTILWRGSPEHGRDILTYKEPIDRSIAFRQDWKFRFAGLNPWMLISAPNIEFAQVVDPFVYYNQNRREAPSIMQVPLYDCPFNRCKSNIAFIEGTQFGALCLVPDWEEWQVAGAVKYKDPIHYGALLNAMIGGEFNFDEQVNIAWEYIQSNLLLSKINERRVELIEYLKDHR